MLLFSGVYFLALEMKAETRPPRCDGCP